MGEIRKTYDIEFKRKAVAILEGLGQNGSQDLGIDDRWFEDGWLTTSEKELRGSRKREAPRGVRRMGDRRRPRPWRKKSWVERKMPC